MPGEARPLTDNPSGPTVAAAGVAATGEAHTAGREATEAKLGTVARGAMLTHKEEAGVSAAVVAAVAAAATVASSGVATGCSSRARVTDPAATAPSAAEGTAGGTASPMPVPARTPAAVATASSSLDTAPRSR